MTGMDGAPALAVAPFGETIDEMCELTADAESLGFDSAWTSELHRTAYLPLAAMAERTATIGLGTAIALAFVRSPMTTALTALDLDEISGGRFVLGLGAGVRRLNEDWHGARVGRPAQHLREVVSIVREFVAGSDRGETLELSGEHERFSLRGYERPFPPQRRAIPIYLAAVGPVTLRLAGEIADGWIGHELCTPEYLQGLALPALDEGARRGGRRRHDVRVVASACCVVGRDRAEACRQAAGLVAFYATVRTSADFFAFHGFAAEAEEIQRRFAAGDVDGMIAACPDEMVARLTIAGTKDDVVAGVHRYEGLADVLKLSPPTHLVPVEVTRRSQQAVLEIFGK
jgi:probable F420-dependent oxidoreductase